MSATVFLFPGQGAQKPGMGGDLIEAYPEARAVFETADEALGFALSEKILHGSDEDLTDTAIQQPAILTVSLAVLAAMRSEAPEVTASVMAGLSLGEYAALAAAGALEVADAISLVEKRGRYMAEACDINPGSMASIIGLDAEQVAEACGEASSDGYVCPANYNSPLQTVISGEVDAVEAACRVCDEKGAKKVVRLDVSGAFHSRLMEPAAEKLAAALDAVEIKAPPISVIQNASGALECDPAAIRGNLVRQLTEPVQWVRTMERIAADGVTQAFEIGPGRVLAGLFKRTDKSVKVTSLLSAESLGGLGARVVEEG